MRPLRSSRTGCVVVLFILGCAKDDCVRSGATTNSEGESKLPPIRLLDLDGQPFDLWRPDKAAVATVVVFTRTDCPISNQYAPEIRRLYETYRPRGVDFYLIYVDPREQPDDIRRHLREYDYPCRGLRDPGHTLVAHCGATATPEAVVFGPDRSITYLGRVDDLYADIGRSRAEPTTHDLADAIESTVLGRPVAKPRTKAVGCLIADLKD
jgi:hypothetical protein